MVAIIPSSRETERGGAVRRVLIVDDDRDAADSLGELLESDGYTVATTYDASGAVELMATFDAAVALIDIRLGSVDGLDLAADLKQRRPDLICLMVTAYVATESAVEALRAGADDYLRKPVRPEELFAALERAFVKRQLLVDKQTAEAALRESEKRYREVFEQSPIGIWEEDWSEVKRMLDGLAADGVEDWRDYFERHPGQVAAAYDLARIVDISQATLDLYHAPDVATMESISAAALVTPEELEAFRDSLIFFLEGGERFDVDVVNLRADGEDMIIHARLVIPRNRAQDWSRVIYAIEDITERKLTEDALRASEERYALAMKGTNEGLWDWDIIPNKMYISPQIRVLLGVTADTLEITTDIWRPRIHPDDIESYLEAQRAYLDGETEAFEFEYRLLDGDKDNRWVYERGICLRDENGKPYRMAGSLGDITERKRAEEALRESEARLRAIMDHAPAEIYMIDSDGRYVLVNREFERRYEMTEDDVVGKKHHDIFPDATADEFSARDREVLETGELATWEQLIPYLGEMHASLEVKFPIVDAAGEVIGLGGMATDITERRKLEGALAQAKKWQAVGQLTGGVAHEFNNLLQVIVAGLDVVEQETEGLESVAAMTRMTRQSALKGAALIQRLLSYVGEQPLRPTAIDVGELVADVAARLGAELDETIDVEVLATDEPCFIRVDRENMEQAIVNLANNARDAMPAGGTLTIETASVDIDEAFAAKRPYVIVPGEYVRIVVTDTGTGMSPEVMEQAFDPFFTTKDFGQGAGLGLSMVFGFIRRQSDGFVEIDSTPGQGTTVSLYLPRKGTGDEAEPRNKAAGTAPATDSGRART